MGGDRAPVALLQALKQKIVTFVVAHQELPTNQIEDPRDEAALAICEDILACFAHGAKAIKHTSSLSAMFRSHKSSESVDGALEPWESRAEAIWALMSICCPAKVIAELEHPKVPFKTPLARCRAWIRQELHNLHDYILLLEQSDANRVFSKFYEALTHFLYRQTRSRRLAHAPKMYLDLTASMQGWDAEITTVKKRKKKTVASSTNTDLTIGDVARRFDVRHVSAETQTDLQLVTDGDVAALLKAAQHLQEPVGEDSAPSTGTGLSPEKAAAPQPPATQPSAPSTAPVASPAEHAPMVKARVSRAAVQRLASVTSSVLPFGQKAQPMYEAQLPTYNPYSHEMANYFFDIGRVVGLADQDFQCWNPECNAAIGINVPARLCWYTGKHYCDKCHVDDLSVVPGMVLNSWDHEEKPVCRAAKAHIHAHAQAALIRLEYHAPWLRQCVKELAQVIRARAKITQLGIIMKSCPKIDLLQACRLSPEYLVNETLFSLEALQKVADGRLMKELERDVKVLDQHLDDCPDCSTRPQTGPQCPFDNDELKFHLAEGECVWLQGASGAGKTLSSLQVLGLTTLPDVDCQVNWRDDLLHHNRAGMLFQQGVLIDELSLHDNILLGLQAGEGTAATSEQVKALLESVGLSAKDMHKMPNELSGGMLRRATLAQLLSQEKRVIVLDEPFIGLDATTANGIARQLSMLMKTKKTAFLLISHQEAYAKLLRPVRTVRVVPKAAAVSPAAAPSQIPLAARVQTKVADYLGATFPLIFVSFLAAGLAISLLTANVLHRTDVSDRILEVVDDELRSIPIPSIKQMAPLIKLKVNRMIDDYAPDVKLTLFCYSMAQLFVVEVGPLLTTFPPFVLFYRSLTFTAIIMGCAEWRARRPSLQPRNVASAITSAVVSAGVAIIVADGLFSQIMLHC
ncbi:uncharacterized protein MONBRDRAFT_31799 [Monosiga brevicollis MX1]|uniref:ABC transporter domain-containing protein n=1 Tax=Monosiga brevicollis TaxID=81824 RepID=A9UVG2_MONBE|nr:uncharacterized protein MONBRDRAFT_31799 [Monosiga brevicollis MX1]EDQ90576.1 predicted protein [Monosiga brevicollis MX1]|eukprot:XP_001744627.1 hypothetical protein [Monosiga brevicollis MX1]